jgi:hypothetical protein
MKLYTMRCLFWKIIITPRLNHRYVILIEHDQHMDEAGDPGLSVSGGDISIMPFLYCL